MRAEPDRRTSRARWCSLAVLLGVMAVTANAQQNADHRRHEGHSMKMRSAGMVMNENHTNLPRDCTGISRDYAFTIRAGTEYARGIPGMIFGLSQHELRVEPCSRIEITFDNEDQVRHQWMVHGLPTYLYPGGMFHIEASGGSTLKGTFIVPAEDRTYLVHCDLAQHMEKGMRGQLVVGRGSGDLWAVQGISDWYYRSSYLPASASWWFWLALLLTFFGSIWLFRNQ